MRQLKQIISAQPAQEGAGVNIYRLAGPSLHPLLNPFLMVDEINSDDAADYVAGFPEHPHRGLVTISYMKAGSMRHRDHMNNEGVIGAGDVQWMMAGAGVLHSEMPEQDDGLLQGFQIWLNLPAAEKMQPAVYQDILAADISEHRLSHDGVVRVIAGEVAINKNVLQGVLPEMTTKPVFVDVKLAPKQIVELSFNEVHPALVYVYSGEANGIASRQLGVYESGKVLQLAAGDLGVELLVLSGKKINEPVAQHGPFVMNTREEILQAFEDFQSPEFLRRLTSETKAIK